MSVFNEAVDASTSDVSTTNEAPGRTEHFNVIDLSEVRAKRTRSLVQAANIYPLIDNDSLRIANRLIREALQCLEQGGEAEEEGNLFASDAETMRLMGMLPELFCLKISDPFAMIVSSIYHSLLNMRGEPLNDERREAFASALLLLQKEPFLAEDRALDAIERFEDVGLNHDMPELEYLAELLIEPLNAESSAPDSMEQAALG